MCEGEDMRVRTKVGTMWAIRGEDMRVRERACVYGHVSGHRRGDDDGSWEWC